MLFLDLKCKLKWTRHILQVACAILSVDNISLIIKDVLKTSGTKGWWARLALWLKKKSWIELVQPPELICWKRSILLRCRVSFFNFVRAVFPENWLMRIKSRQILFIQPNIAKHKLSSMGFTTIQHLDYIQVQWKDVNLYVFAAGMTRTSLKILNSSRTLVRSCVTKACWCCHSHWCHDVNMANVCTFMNNNGGEENCGCLQVTQSRTITRLLLRSQDREGESERGSQTAW